MSLVTLESLLVPLYPEHAVIGELTSKPIVLPEFVRPCLAIGGRLKARHRAGIVERNLPMMSVIPDANVPRGTAYLVQSPRDRSWDYAMSWRIP